MGNFGLHINWERLKCVTFAKKNGSKIKLKLEYEPLEIEQDMDK